MSKKSGWTIDVKNLSNQKLVEISLQLDGSEHVEVVDSLRRELVERLRATGRTTDEIIRQIALNVPRGRRLNEIARAWARLVGVSAEEFRRIADVKWKVSARPFLPAILRAFLWAQ